MTSPEEDLPDGPFEHGIEVVPTEDGVELIDTRSAGRPSVNATQAEFDAFMDGVLRGEFDFTEPPGSGGVTRPRTGADEGDL